MRNGSSRRRRATKRRLSPDSSRNSARRCPEKDRRASSKAAKGSSSSLLVCGDSCKARFRHERELVRMLVRFLRSGNSPLGGSLLIQEEVGYDRGRPDILIVTSTGDVVTVEAKLLRWPEALNQAFRHTTFAHRSFVAVPCAVATRAARHAGDFRHSGVGLLAVDTSECRTVLPGRKTRHPLLGGMTKRMRLMVTHA
jgi:hypothetical protein